MKSYGKEGVLPCPFCETSDVSEIKDEEGHQFICKDCGAKAGKVKNRDSALKMWNSRVPKYVDNYSQQ